MKNNYSHPISFRFTLPLVLVACVLSSLVAVPTAKAYDEFAYDLRLITALMDAKMTSWAEAQVARMKREYPDKADRINITMAEGYYDAGKRSFGNQLLEKVPPSSPYYAESRILMGQEAMRRGKLEEAEAALKTYFDSVVVQDIDSQTEAEAFQKAVQNYATIAVQKANPKLAEERAQLLKKLEGRFEVSKATQMMMEGRFVIHAALKQKEQGGRLNKRLVNSACEKLNKIQWLEGASQITCYAFIAKSKGLIALDRYREAQDALEGVSDIAVAIEKRRGKDGSPVPELLYLYGRSSRLYANRLAQSNDASKRAAAEEMYKKAFMILRKLKNKYRDSQIYRSVGLTEFDKAKNDLEEYLGGRLKEGEDGDGKKESFYAAMQEAKNFFEAKNYEKASEFYFKAFRSYHHSESLAPGGLRFSYALAKQNRYLEAAVIASFVADLYPEHDQAVSALKTVGASAYSTAKNENDTNLTNLALAVWEQFAKLASPDIDHAPDIAFIVAESYYGKAIEVAKKTRDIQDWQKKEDMKAKARTLFRAAIPHYRRVIERFGASSKAVRSYYKLGWIYTNVQENSADVKAALQAKEKEKELEQLASAEEEEADEDQLDDALEQLEEPGQDAAAKAAENFLMYARAERSSKHAMDRLRAKFRAGEQFMYSSEPLRAEPILKELLKWTKPGNDQNFDPEKEEVKEFREYATSYLGWTYDLGAEAKYRSLIYDQQSKIRENKDLINRLGEEIEVWQLEKQTAQTLLKELETIQAEKEQWAQKPLPRPEQRALTDRKKARQIEALSEAEKAAAIERIKASAKYKELKQEYRSNELNILNGGIKQRQSIVNSISAELGDLEKRLESIQEEYDDLVALESLEIIEDKAARLEDAKAELVRARSELEDKLQSNIDLWKGRKEQVDKALEKRPNPGEKLERMSRVANSKYEFYQNLKDENSFETRSFSFEFEEEYPDLVSAFQKAFTEHKRARKAAKRLSKIRSVQKRKSIVKTEVDYLKKHRDLISSEIALLNTKVELLKIQDVEERAKAAETELSSAVATVTKTTADYVEKARAFGEQQLEMAEEALNARKARIADLRAEITDLENRIEENREKMLDLKEKALAYFRDYINQYPEGMQTAQNMARAGSILVELGEFDEASEVLNNLKQDYPDSTAMASAMFDLGRAELKRDRVEAASKAFNEAMKNVEAVNLSDLTFVLRKLYDSDQSQSAYLAGKELLRRVQNSEHPDYRLLTEYKERIYFQTGLAAVNNGNLEAGEELLNELLEINKQTPYLWEVLIGLSKAYNEMGTEEGFKKAVQKLVRIVRIAGDIITKRRAKMKLADLRIDRAQETNNAKLLKQTLISLSFIYVNDDGVNFLGEDIPETWDKVKRAKYRGYFDSALYYIAKCYALLGEEEKEKLCVQFYKERFPNGKYVSEISNLPAPM